MVVRCGVSATGTGDGHDMTNAMIAQQSNAMVFLETAHIRTYVWIANFAESQQLRLVVLYQCSECMSFTMNGQCR